jgi:hypothetical protein
MTLKKAKQVAHLQVQTQGFRSANLSEQLGDIDPFIILTDFYMPKAFFPPHPHAGFSVMTYLFTDSAGAFINRDSLGDRSRIEAGAIHLTQAGKGIFHEEIPEIEGQMCHGLQMWLNHAAKDRFVEPKAMHVSSAEVPEVVADQYLVRVLLGRYQDTAAAIKPLPEVTLLDVHLQPHAKFTHTVEPGHISFLLMIDGQAKFDNHDLPAHAGVKFTDEGDTIEISTANNKAAFLLATGRPFHEETIFGGPFVMSSTEQMRQTKLRYQHGEMGHLEPSAIFNR